jgi:hypothetical protein
MQGYCEHANLHHRQSRHRKLPQGLALLALNQFGTPARMPGVWFIAQAVELRENSAERD